MEVVTTSELIMIVAVFTGPISAIFITRWLDNRRAKSERQVSILRTLMATRGNKLHYEHVAALNSIEIDFQNDHGVMQAWKDYLENLSIFIENKSKEEMDVIFRKREHLFTLLITNMANVLGIRIQQLDILNVNYFPKGWGDEQEEQRRLRLALLNLLDPAYRKFAEEQRQGIKISLPVSMVSNLPEDKV